jgi:prepilin-type N-terminal cleavage/methylation domain-containing protein
MRSRLQSVRRAGFTMIEVIIVFVVLGIVVAVVAPRASRAVQRARLDRAATVVAADLESGFALAARQRKPVRLTRGSATGTVQYTFALRSTGAALLTRHLGRNTEYSLTSMTFSQNVIDFFPTGRSSQPLNVTLTATTGTRCVTMTRAGFVRVLAASAACN